MSAERATIGALLLLPLPEVRSVLAHVRDDDPADPKLRVILRGIREVAERGITTDPETVRAHLRSTGAVSTAGLPDLMVTLADLVSVDTVPIPRQVVAYATSMIEEAARRRIGEAADAMAAAASQSSLDDLVEVVTNESVAACQAVQRLGRSLLLGVSA